MSPDATSSGTTRSVAAAQGGSSPASPLWARPARPRARSRAVARVPAGDRQHPETGRVILAGVGRCSAGLKHGATCGTLPDDEHVLAVSRNRAVALVDARIG
ncbi:MAG: hypothetical protein F4X98_00965 [Gammaproteobacteria bacterium]|nr:hypothetical protein [Gammaproteobacteria bacterium]